MLRGDQAQRDHEGDFLREGNGDGLVSQTLLVGARVRVWRAGRESWGSPAAGVCLAFPRGRSGQKTEGRGRLTIRSGDELPTGQGDANPAAQRRRACRVFHGDLPVVSGRRSPRTAHITEPGTTGAFGGHHGHLTIVRSRLYQFFPLQCLDF